MMVPGICGKSIPERQGRGVGGGRGGHQSLVKARRKGKVFKCEEYSEGS